MSSAGLILSSSTNGLDWTPGLERRRPFHADENKTTIIMQRKSIRIRDTKANWPFSAYLCVIHLRVNLMYERSGIVPGYSVLLTLHEITGVGRPSAAHSSSIRPLTVTSWLCGISVILGGTACTIPCDSSVNETFILWLII